MKSLLRTAFILFAAVAAAQTCPDVAEESHHELLHQDKVVRIFRLDLPRLASSELHCHAHPYFRIVVTDSRTADTLSGDAPVLHDWYPGATRWMLPSRHKARNDTGSPHREYIVETQRSAEYNPLSGNYDQDEFTVAAPTASWTLVSNRGPLTARKVQLAPGTAVDIPSPDILLIALTDIELRGARPDGEPIRLSKGDYRLLDGAKIGTLRNAGKSPAQFITVEY